MRVLRYVALNIVNRNLTSTTTLLVCFMISCVSSIVKATNHQTEANFQASDYFASTMLPETNAQKIILVHIDQSSDMLERAYPTDVFDPTSNDGNEGYFNPRKQYRYRDKEQFFEEDDSLTQGHKDAWSGQFLNWLVMRKFDLLQLLLLGSGVESNQRVIELVADPAIKETTIHDPQSQNYSPITSSTPINLKSGQLEYQNKIIRLRIKHVQDEKGLLSFITPNIQFYFYSHRLLKVGKQYTEDFRFGDQEKLVTFLKAWKPNEQIQNKYTYQKAHYKALDETLEHIKNKASQEVSLNSNQKALCQRYVHISMAHSKFGSLLLDDEILNDCQPKIRGNQTLKRFQWAAQPAEKTAGQNAGAKSIYSYVEKHRLFKAIFNTLFSEEQSRSYQVTGADMSQFADGSAVLYQSISQYSQGDSYESINWVGDLRAFLVDDYGRIRSDNGDKKLGSLSEDELVTSCFDKVDNLLRFRFSKQDLPESKCTQLNYPYLDKDVGYLWQASQQLNKLPQQNIPIQRFPFRRSEHKRYIRTHIGQKEYDFVDGSRYPLQAEILGMRSEKERRDFINYVRGKDQKDKRSRRVGNQSFLLGDTFQNSHVVVGKPAANYHMLYGDNSYGTFLKQYRDRRSRVFMVNNNGLLHSFNAGWYDAENKQVVSSKRNASSWDLGQETWAFIPYSVLPYLVEQSHQLYGLSPEQHLSLFTQKPYIFDAKVFGVNALKGQPDRLFYDDAGTQFSRDTHPGGWGTLMVVGAGLGNVKSDDFKPSFLVFDITDAEQAPKFLASIKTNDLGSAISLPSVVTKKDAQGKVQWFLALGSGTGTDPESVKKLHSKHSARVYLYNLKILEQPSSSLKSKIIALKEPNAYVNGIAAVDWNLNGETDALYVNTTSQKSTQKGLAQSRGSLHRISFKGLNATSLLPETQKVFTTGSPLLSRPQLSLDKLNNRWIFLASAYKNQPQKTGLFEDKIIGIKEPRDKNGKFLYESSYGQSNVVSENSLLDVTEVLVSASTGQLSGSLAIQPKLNESTVAALEHRVMAYSEPQNYITGWLRRIDKGEVPHGENKLFGGMLSQATFKATYPNCQLSGDAFIHRLRFTTGTSWFEKRQRNSLAKKTNATLTNTKGLFKDTSAVNSILLHSQGKTLRQVQSSANGKTKTVLEENRVVPVSSELSWREL